MEADLQALREAIQRGDEDGTRRLVAGLLSSGGEPQRILEEGMMPAIEEVGGRFARSEAFIPELIVAAAAMQAGMESMKERLGRAPHREGLILLGTVEGDIHSIGKNLVRMCLEGAGFEVVDLGESVKTQRFVSAYRERRPRIVGLSALLSSTMQRMRDVVEAVRAEDPEALVMVGGAPVTPGFAAEIGASGYAPNAFAAVAMARQLLQKG